MTMLEDKYAKLIELLNNDNLSWVGHSGVPFIIVSYESNEQLKVIDQIQRLKLDIPDFKFEEINMEELLFKMIEKNETVEGIIELEKSDEKVSIPQELGELLLDEIKEYFVTKASELGNKGRILVTRVGASAIYFNFIRLLSYLEGKIQIPIVFFYPGTCDRYSVTLLNKYKETALRALIV